MVGMDVHRSKKDLKSINACRRLLLTTGADPTYVTEVESFLDSVATNPDDEVRYSLWTYGFLPYNVLTETSLGNPRIGLEFRTYCSFCDLSKLAHPRRHVAVSKSMHLPVSQKRHNQSLPKDGRMY